MSGEREPEEVGQALESFARKSHHLLRAAAEVAEDVQKCLERASGTWKEKSRGEAVGLVTRSAASLQQISVSIGKLSAKLERNLAGLEKPTSYRAAPADADSDIELVTEELADDADGPAAQGRPEPSETEAPDEPLRCPSFDSDDPDFRLDDERPKKAHKAPSSGPKDSKDQNGDKVKNGDKAKNGDEAKNGKKEDADESDDDADLRALEAVGRRGCRGLDKDAPSTSKESSKESSKEPSTSATKPKSASSKSSGSGGGGSSPAEEASSKAKGKVKDKAEDAEGPSEEASEPADLSTSTSVVELEAKAEEMEESFEDLDGDLPTARIDGPDAANAPEGQDAADLLGDDFGDDSLDPDELDIFTASAKARQTKADSPPEDLEETKEEEEEEEEKEEAGPSRKRDKPLPAAVFVKSSEDEEEEKEEKEEKGTKRKRGSKRAAIKSSDEEDDDDLFKVDSSDSDSGSVALSAGSDSDVVPVKETKGSKSKRSKDSKDKDDKPKRKRRAKVADSDSSGDKDSEANDSDGSAKGKKKKKKSKSKKDSKESPSKRKGAKKLMTEEELAESTRTAGKREKERVARLQERQKAFNGLIAVEGATPGLPGDNRGPVFKEVILDRDEKTKESLVSVDPGLVKFMKKHQGEGVKFMYESVFESVAEYKKGEHGGGCILAHCMGLGKTFQCVCFVHTVMTNDIYAKGAGKGDPVRCTLVLAPVNAILTWQREFTNWLEKAEEGIDHVVLQATSMKERADILGHWRRSGGVLICGYTMLRNLRNFVEAKMGKGKGGKAKKNAPKVASEIEAALFDPGPDIVIADEGHKLKNDKARITQVVEKIRTRRRVCLTGTPIQNHLEEYYTMVNFVKAGLLGTKKEFKNRFENPIKAGQYLDSPGRAVKQMKQRSYVLNKTLNKAVMRRDYTELVPYLPPKYEFIIYVRLTPMQMELYKKFINTAVGDTDAESLKGRKILPDFHNFSRIWLHPWALLKHQEELDAKRDKLEELDEMADFVVNSDEDDFVDDSDDDKKKKKKKKAAATSSDDEIEIIPEAGSTRRTRNNPDPVEEREVTPEEIRGWWGDTVKPEDETNLSLSSKLMLLFELLKKSEEAGDKLLVFSQSLMSLRIIENFLNAMGRSGEWWSDEHEAVAKPLDHPGWGWEKGKDYYRLDGSINADIRKKLQESFNDSRNPRARLFLISTLAGSLGIDLIGANRVVVFDCCWNPSHDTQSIFRVFRFGQKKPVYVYRFVTQGAMEEVIFRRQVTKQSVQLRVCDDQQIQRHFQQHDVEELYQFQGHVAPTEEDARLKHIHSLKMPKEDKLLCNIILDKGEWIDRLEVHDSLLEHKAEEELSKDEQEEAWKAFERERETGGRFAGFAQGFDPAAPEWYLLARPCLEAAFGHKSADSFYQAVKSWITYGNHSLMQLDQQFRAGISDLNIQFFALLQRDLSPQGIHASYLQLRNVVLNFLHAVYKKENPGLTMEQIETSMRQRLTEWWIPEGTLSLHSGGAGAQARQPIVRPPAPVAAAVSAAQALGGIFSRHLEARRAFEAAGPGAGGSGLVRGGMANPAGQPSNSANAQANAMVSDILQSLASGPKVREKVHHSGK